VTEGEQYRVSSVDIEAPEFLELDKEKILKFLPFEYIYYKPVIFTQNVALPTSFDFMISGLWLIIGIILLMVFWNRSIRHYSSQGG